MLQRDARRFASARPRRPRTAARRRRARRRQLRHRPRARSPTSSASSAVAPNSIDAVSNRDFVARLPRARPRPARRTSRGSAPRSCSGRARSSASCELPDAFASRLDRSCRRRRTPTPPSCCAPRPPRIVGAPGGLLGVLHALPLTYNKDLQEDKEPLFDAVDTLELCLARRHRHGRRRSRFDRERMAAAAADELLAATDLADLLVKRGRSVPRGPRRRRRARRGRVDSRQAALRAGRLGARGVPRERASGGPPRARVVAGIESKVSLGRHRRSRSAVREQLERAHEALSATARVTATSSTAPVHEVARDADRLRAAARRRVRA